MPEMRAGMSQKGAFMEDRIIDAIQAGSLGMNNRKVVWRIIAITVVAVVVVSACGEKIEPCEHEWVWVSIPEDSSETEICSLCGAMKSSRSTNYSLVVAENDDAIRKIGSLNDAETVKLPGITWNGTTKTLILTNFTFTSSSAAATLILRNGGTIVLHGDNTLTNTGSHEESSMGIQSAASDLAIQGGGSLTVTAGTGRESFGIFAAGNLDISEAAVTAGGRTATEHNNNGICVSGSLTIADGAVVSSSAGAAAGMSNGVFAGGGINLSGGTLTAIGSDRAIHNTETAPYHYTVPGGARYWVNTNAEAPDPPGNGTVSDGSFAIAAEHRYAKIVY